MSNDFVRWLLDMRAIPQDAEGLRLAWERPWPAWAWALLGLAALALAMWSYTRLSGSRPGRIMLASVRFVIIVLVLVLISGPMIELPRETIEQDWVLVLADRSQSMQIADAPGGGASERVERDEQLRAILDDSSDVWRTLMEQRHVVWLGFHAGAYELAPPVPPVPPEAPEAPEANRSEGDDTHPAPVMLDEAAGERTNIDAAIEQALQRAAARPLSGVVLFTDGRTTNPPSRNVLRRLQADAVPVFTVPLGSREPIGDLAIARIDSPRRAFVRDKVPVVVELDRFGSAAQQQGATLRLVDEVTGEELDAVELAPGEERSRVTLTATPNMAGQAVWTVVVETTSPDLIPENNVKPLEIDLIDRPLRVLFVDGYPRWEMRYLRNLLIREESIASSTMLLSADPDFAQEGDQPITRLPRSPEEFAEYDVIVLGDVPGSFFSPAQLDMIKAHIAERGAGLLWIAGERYTPASYSPTVLVDLLPMRGPLGLLPIDQPVNMAPTDVADRLGVLRMTWGANTGWPVELTDSSYGWSRLWYAQRIEPGRLKPTAEVLAQTTQEFNGAPLPLVIHMRYGAGQVMYVATDETWRWRYGRGELLHEQFWIQMIRMLGRESLALSDAPVTLEVNPRRLAVNQPMHIVLRVRDAQLIEEVAAATDSVAVVLESADGRTIAELQLRRVEGSEDSFEATYLPDVTGEIAVRLADSTLNLPGAPTVEASVEVFRPDDELRRPETDHDLLSTLAAETGGRVLAPDQMHQLLDPGALRNRSIRTLNPLTETIWDTPLAFALLLLVLTMEWIGRKLLRLA